MLKVIAADCYDQRVAAGRHTVGPVRRTLLAAVLVSPQRDIPTPRSEIWQLSWRRYKITTTVSFTMRLIALNRGQTGDQIDIRLTMHRRVYEKLSRPPS